MKTKKTKTIHSNVDTKGLNTLLQNKGVSQRQLAFKLGLQPAAISFMFRGKRRITVEEAKAIAHTLEISTREILALFGVDAGPLLNHEKARTVPVDGFLDERHVVRPSDYPPGLKGLTRAVCGFQERDVRCLRIQTSGENMLSGALVFYTPQKTFTPDNMDRIGIVKIIGQEDLRMRVVKKGLTRGTYSLEMINGSVAEEDVRIESVSTVVGIQF